MLLAHDIDKQRFSKWLLAIGGHGAHLVNHERLTDGGNSAEDVPFLGCEVVCIFTSSVRTKQVLRKDPCKGPHTDPRVTEHCVMLDRPQPKIHIP